MINLTTNTHVHIIMALAPYALHNEVITLTSGCGQLATIAKRGDPASQPTAPCKRVRLGGFIGTKKHDVTPVGSERGINTIHNIKVLSKHNKNWFFHD